jgi:RNA-directed DNA polymerase
VDELKAPGKPFEISKRAVWEAWEKVKANKGAPGGDGQTIAEFEKDLKNNLFKIWNRMSSGSHFPPPVRAVEIEKAHGGGTRMLGVPTVADRIAQTVVAQEVVAGELEKKVDPIFHPDSYGYRPKRSALDAVATCRARCWKTNWVIDLDIRKFFDSVPWDLVVKAVQANTDLPWVCRGWCCMSSGGSKRRLCCPTARCRSETGDPTGLRGLARDRESVPALCVRRVDGPEVFRRHLRALRGRRGGALRQ